MKKQYLKKCKCCGEPFQTTKGNKVYKTGHQKTNNNDLQNERRKAWQILSKPIAKTYEVYNELLGELSFVTVSYDYLKGRSVETFWMTHLQKFGRLNEPHIHDIMILHFEHFIMLKRRKFTDLISYPLYNHDGLS
ncbi:MAG: hypothetical protein RIR55_182 [Bacteroidota bacterium]|jgi:hypothetical protein